MLVPLIIGHGIKARFRLHSSISHWHCERRLFIFASFVRVVVVARSEFVTGALGSKSIRWCAAISSPRPDPVTPDGPASAQRRQWIARDKRHWNTEAARLFFPKVEHTYQVYCGGLIRKNQSKKK